MPVASAQVKSCVLLAGLLAGERDDRSRAVPTRDHTERMLAAMGATIRREGQSLTIEPGERLEAGDVPVPGDFSSAAFFVAAGLLVPGSEIELREVGINRGRIGLLSILSRMGVEMGSAHEEGRAVTVHEIREPGPEPIATLRVRSAELRGAEITAEDVPGAIDELPLVALLGCFAEGETVVDGAAELRAKESDRIAGVVEGLSALGAEIEARPDGFAVTGTGGLRGGTLDARGDHRLAMVGAIAGLASREGVEVGGFDAVGVSYPRFERDLRSADRLVGALRGVPVAGPRREHQEDPGVLDRLNLVALGGIEDRQQSGAPRGPLATGGVDLHVAVDYQDPGTLMDLMLLELLALGQVDDDRPALGLGFEDLRLMRLDFELVDVPALHGHAALYIRSIRRDRLRPPLHKSLRATAFAPELERPWGRCEGETVRLPGW